MTYLQSCKGGEGTLFNINYNGTNGTDGLRQEWNIPCTGKFKLEVWGAQGGYERIRHNTPGGYGGYSIGVADLTHNNKLIVSVGGIGQDTPSSATLGAYTIASGSVYELKAYTYGGWNGGGNGVSGRDHNGPQAGAGGGGATSVQTGLLGDGQLKQYSSSKNSVLIVAGGGGGTGEVQWNIYATGVGGSGGGYTGNAGTGDCGTYACGNGGTQSEGGTSYGKAANLNDSDAPLANQVSGSFGMGGYYTSAAFTAGGGGGWYGGGSSQRGHGGAGGGSGYIGNSSLISYGSVTKHMTGYNLTNTTTTANIRTQTTTCVSATATADCAKSGHGAARITIIE